MSLTLVVPDEIAQAAADLAKRSGASTEQLLLDTLRARFLEIPPELQEEFEMWERASDEDFAKWVRENEDV